MKVDENEKYSPVVLYSRTAQLFRQNAGFFLI